MDFTDTNACRKRLACGDCRSRPEWRKAMGAPEVCPSSISPVAPIVKDCLTVAQKQAICRACPDFGTRTCCGCQDARKEPWRELSSCRFGRWLPLAPPCSVG